MSESAVHTYAGLDAVTMFNGPKSFSAGLQEWACAE